jgi:hypothetical protein
MKTLDKLKHWSLASFLYPKRKRKQTRHHRNRRHITRKRHGHHDGHTHERVCDPSLSFEECELAVLRVAVDKAEEKQGQQVVQSPAIQKIIQIVEKFIQSRKLICYGGTAINNILPKHDQFYNKNTELPDYDFFSPQALEDAKALADLYAKSGYEEVEAKSGQHVGTYKVFVNFIPVADVSHLPAVLYQALHQQALKIGNIYYAPPNYLRMGMYLELSRPDGDVSRWEKVLKRLTLLNKNYPVTSKNCSKVDFQRKMSHANRKNAEKIFEITKRALLDKEVVFFGGFAMSLYLRYLPSHERKQVQPFIKESDFDVLSETPKKTAEYVQQQLIANGFPSSLTQQPGIGELVAPHYEIKIGTDTIAFVYEPLACHNYNTIDIGGSAVRIATIDTMLSFYLAFLFGKRLYHDTNRILCMADYLFQIQEKNRLTNVPILKRFSLKCIGHQETREEIRSHKTELFQQLKNKKNTLEYEKYFLAYRPTTTKTTTKSKTKTKTPHRNNKHKTKKTHKTKQHKTKQHKTNKQHK